MVRFAEPRQLHARGKLCTAVSRRCDSPRGGQRCKKRGATHPFCEAASYVCFWIANPQFCEKHQHEAAGQYLTAAHVGEAGQRPAAAGMRMHLNLKTRERARAREPRARPQSRRSQARKDD